MEDFERLLREGLSWDNMKKIMGAPQLAKHLLLLGLPMKVVKEVSCGPESWAFKGSKSSCHA